MVGGPQPTVLGRPGLGSHGACGDRGLGRGKGSLPLHREGAQLSRPPGLPCHMGRPFCLDTPPFLSSQASDAPALRSRPGPFGPTLLRTGLGRMAGQGLGPLGAPTSSCRQPSGHCAGVGGRGRAGGAASRGESLGVWAGVSALGPQGCCLASKWPLQTVWGSRVHRVGRAAPGTVPSADQHWPPPRPGSSPGATGPITLPLVPSREAWVCAHPRPSHTEGKGLRGGPWVGPRLSSSHHRMGTQHPVLRTGPSEGVSGEAARDGVSGHLRLGRGACSVSGIWPGHGGLGGLWVPSGEKGAGEALCPEG